MNHLVSVGVRRFGHPQANTARSAQSRRGRGLVRRRTATSWRSTRSSTSLAEEVRPSSRTSPSTCRKIQYSSRSDTPGSCPTSDQRWSATQARLLALWGLPDVPPTTVPVLGVDDFALRRGDWSSPTPAPRLPRPPRPTSAGAARKKPLGRTTTVLNGAVTPADHEFSQAHHVGDVV